MGTPTRFTYGMTTVAKGTPLGSYPMRDPFHSSSDQGYGVAEYSNDFFTVNSEDFTIAGSGSSLAMANGAGGLAVLTPGGTTTVTSAIKPGLSTSFIAGQKVWYTTSFAVSATTGTFTAGLASAGTSATDGLYFVTSGTSVNLVSRVGSTNTTLVSGVATIAAGTQIQLAYHYNNTDLVVFVNGNLVARVSNVTIGSSGTNLTSASLAPYFAITPTATETMTIDYVLAAQEIAR